MIGARVFRVARLAGVLLSLAGLLVGCGPVHDREHATPAAPVRVEPRSVADGEAVIGDPANGARLYRVHCSSCHGLSGGGDGSAASLLYPAPRAHTDPSYMNRRTAQEIHDAIAGGGPALGLSALMPRWDELFGGHQIWDLAAHVRSLYQPISAVVPRAAAPTVHEVVLSDERFADVARVSGSQLAPGSRKVTYYSIGLETPTTGVSPTFVMFGNATLAGASVPLALAVGSTDRIGAVKTFPRVVLQHRGATLRHAVDRFLASLAGSEVLRAAVPAALPEELSAVAPPLLDTLRQMGYLLRAARAQKDADDADGDARRRLLKESPDQLSAGERLFLQACAACHGPTGKGALVPGAFENLRSRNLSDGAHLNRQSDESLLFLFRHGGEKARLSSSMPGFGSVFDEAKLKSILDHVRSLARPRKEAARAP